MRWPFARSLGRKGHFRKEEWGVVGLYQRDEAPPMLSVANKAGSNNAIAGYIVPLDKTPQEVDLMHARLDGGDYGVVTPDRKAAFTVRVAPLHSIEGALEEMLENRPNPESEVGRRFERLLNREPLMAGIRISEVGQRAEVVRDLLYLLADRIAVQGAGIMRDVAINRWWDAGEWSKLAREAPDHPALRFCAVAFVEDERTGGTWGCTRGLYRFGRPEMAVLVRHQGMHGVSVEFLIGMASYVINGATIQPGHTVGGDERRTLQAFAPKDLPEPLRGWNVLALRPMGLSGTEPPFADEALRKIMEG